MDANHAIQVRVPISKSSKFLHLFVISVSLLLLSGSTKPAQADLIDDVCARTIYDKRFCAKALRSDPRSQGADLVTLARITIDLGNSYIESTKTLIGGLNDRATHPNLKSNYRACLEGYNDTIGDLGDCADALRRKDYASLRNYAGDIGVSPDDCDRKFSDPPVPEPEELKRASLQIQELSDALLVISRKLQGQIE